MNSETQWTVYRTRFLVRARQLTKSLVFTDALGREQCGRPGDYLVESNDGIRRITTKAIFEDIYVPVTSSGAPAIVARTISRDSPADPRNADPRNDDHRIDDRPAADRPTNDRPTNDRRIDDRRVDDHWIAVA
jgi:hypothetical protein